MPGLNARTIKKAVRSRLRSRTPLDESFAGLPLRDTQNHVVRIFTSGLAQAFALSLVGFLLIGVFWALLEDFGLLESTLPYAGVLGEINIIIGFVYNLWINRSFRGYTAPAEQYRMLLMKIKTFAHVVFSLIHGRRQMVLQEYITNVSEEDRKFTELQIHKLNELLQALILLSEELFGPNYYHAHRDLMFDYGAEYAFVGHSQNESPKDQMEDIQSEIIIVIKRLELTDVISAPEASRLLSKLDPITESIEHIDVSQTVREPSLFMNHVWVILAVWFTVLLPYRIVITAGYATLGIYPIVAMLLTGIVIIRKWLRTPFDPDRPWPMNDCEKWCQEFRDQIERLSRVSYLASESGLRLDIDRKREQEEDLLLATESKSRASFRAPSSFGPLRNI